MKAITNILIIVFVSSLFSCKSNKNDSDNKQTKHEIEISFQKQLLSSIPNYAQSADYNRHVFSPTGKTVAVIITRAKKSHLLVNNVHGKEYDAISFPLFSLDGENVAYIASSNSKELVVLNNKEGKGYKNIENLTFSPDGKKIAYIAEEDKKSCVVIDTNENKKYDGVSKLIFSQDGKNIAYIAEENKKHFVVVNNTKMKDYDNILELSFSSDDSTTITTVGINKKGDEIKDMLVIGDKEITEFDDSYGAKVSSLGDIAYNVKHKNKYFTVVKNKSLGEEYESAYFNNFSPDGQHYCFTGKRKDSTFLIVDNSHIYQYKSIWNPVFSPNGERIAFSASDGKTYFVVVDGQRGKDYESVWEPLFSPDGKHFAYIALNKNKFYVVNDGNESEGYESVFKNYSFSSMFQVSTYRRGAIVFSQDGKLAYVASKAAKYFVVVNGRKSSTYDFIGGLSIIDHKDFAEIQDEKGIMQFCPSQVGSSILVGSSDDYIISQPVIYFNKDCSIVSFGARIQKDIWWNTLKTN